ncbi:osmolarity response regulator [Klebsiella variicola]|uniref:Osmolarity response regulator n=1 Tax=Klebsiella variicola TaxID=244366 RepID=A0A7H4M8X2_KLEVA|nr:osmolarity response regulator [Klebsiella variicola]
MQENYKILVVDDDMRLRALLERYLNRAGLPGS